MDLDFEKENGLIPAIIQEAVTRDVLMLGFMNREALETTFETGFVTFYSRSRKNCGPREKLAASDWCYANCVWTATSTLSWFSLSWRARSCATKATVAVFFVAWIGTGTPPLSSDDCSQPSNFIPRRGNNAAAQAGDPQGQSAGLYC